MARIARDRGEPVPTPAAVEARVQEFERSAATRIVRSPYVDQAAGNLAFVRTGDRHKRTPIARATTPTARR